MGTCLVVVLVPIKEMPLFGVCSGSRSQRGRLTRLTSSHVGGQLPVSAPFLEQEEVGAPGYTLETAQMAAG